MVQEESDAGVPRVVTTRCAVIGHPVAHSLSPVLHRAAARELGWDLAYEAVDLTPAEAPGFVSGLDPSEWAGLSVTMPHKAMIVEHGEPDDLVRLLGVANTLALRPTPIVRNTDVTGAVRALGLHGIAEVPDAVVLGTGATARSMLAALARVGCRRVEVRGRSRERAAALGALGEALGIEVRPALHTDPVDHASLVVSTLPGTAQGSLVAELTALVDAADAAFDVSYDPWPSVVAREASARGRPVVSGLELLAGQAVDQVRLFSGRDVGIDVLVEAGRQELRRRRGAERMGK